MILCSCNVLPTEAFKRAIERHADDIRQETTLKRAAALVFRSARDEEGLVVKDGCAGSCLPTVEKMVLESGLFPAEKLRLPVATEKKSCGECSSCSCKVPALSIP